MSVVRMHIESADALADAYSRAANDARHAIAELSPLVTESNRFGVQSSVGAYLQPI